jgi:uncharacterized protein (TIGR00730 family)
MTEPTHSFDNIHETDPRQESEPRPPDEPEALDAYVAQIKETADKLLRDGANRGDVKLLATAARELRYSFKVLNMLRHRRKVSVFGSARLPLEDPSCVQAVEFGKRMAAEDWMVITGAGAGVMGAGHLGAGRDHSVGLNILLPFEQSANPVVQGSATLMHLKYFFTRKLLFVKESDAVVLFPGGFGTLDEGFEVLTLVQTGKSHMFPIVMVDVPGNDYWQHFYRFCKDVLLARGLISPEDLHLFKVTTSVDEAVNEVFGFYRVYHSMRYVKKDLVLRLNRPIATALLERIRDEFEDIVKAGTFELTTALPQEQNDAKVAHLPRLRFRFDRHRLGRLRQLIDVLNREG